MNTDNIKVILDPEEDIVTTMDSGSIKFGQLEIGTTTTGEAGTKAIVTNSGSSSRAILNFTIPRGAKGEDGLNGKDGKDGAIQYVAGENITIEGNVISATGGGTGGTNDYNDLINKPTIPTKTSELTNDSDFIDEIPIASANILGGIKVGDNLTIEEDGTLNATASASGSGADDVPINTIVEYEGTTVPDGWEEVEDKPFIQCGLTSNVSLSTTRVYLVFDNNIQRGNMFSVDEDGGVRVNDDVEEGYLKLHFHTNINNAGVSVSNIACSIYKNNEEIIALNNSLPTTTSRCQLIGDVILNYKAGDVFKVRLVLAENTATAIASLYRTLLILEKI